MQTVRIIFLAIHIICAGFAIAQVPVALYFRRSIKRAEGTPSELTLMGAMGQMMGILGQVGGLGLLISGLVLSSVNPNYGLLGLTGPTPLWLMIKQIVFIIIIGLVMVVLTPAAKRATTTLIGAAQSGSPVTVELRGEFSKTEQVSIVINLLVLLNIILAVWKPTA